MKKLNCDVIDYTKPKHYQDKEWNSLVEKQEKSCKKKVKKWKSSGSKDFIEVKNGRLYEGGEPIYKWKGWGLGAGMTYYNKGRGKYKTNLSTNKEFYEGYLKKFMSPFKIPLDKWRTR